MALIISTGMYKLQNDPVEDSFFKYSCKTVCSEVIEFKFQEGL